MTLTGTNSPPRSLLYRIIDAGWFHDAVRPSRQWLPPRYRLLPTSLAFVAFLLSPPAPPSTSPAELSFDRRGGGIKNMDRVFHSEQSGVKLESRSFPLTAIGNLANRFQSIPIRSSIQSRSGFKSSDPIDLQPPAQPIRSSSDPGGERRRELRNSIKSNLIQSNYWIMQIQFAHLTGNHLASPPPPLSPPSWSQTPPKMKKNIHESATPLDCNQNWIQFRESMQESNGTTQWKRLKSANQPHNPIWKFNWIWLQAIQLKRCENLTETTIRIDQFSRPGSNQLPQIGAKRNIQSESYRFRDSISILIRILVG